MDKLNRIANTLWAIVALLLVFLLGCVQPVYLLLAGRVIR